MKLDKMKFARLVAMLVMEYKYIHHEIIEQLDSIIDIEPVASPMNNSQLEGLMQEMANGTHKIEAIRYYRALTGMPLKDSKDTVEKYWRTTQQISATELQAKMLNVLNDNKCMINGEGLKDTVRDFIRSFSSY